MKISLPSIGLRDAPIAVTIVWNTWCFVAVEICFAQSTMGVTVKFHRIFIIQTMTLLLLRCCLIISSTTWNPWFDDWACYTFEVRHVFILILILIILARFWLVFWLLLLFDQSSKTLFALNGMFFLVASLPLKSSFLFPSTLYLKLQFFIFFLYLFLSLLQSCLPHFIFVCFFFILFLFLYILYYLLRLELW